MTDWSKASIRDGKEYIKAGIYDLKGKVALITGAAGKQGIGRRIALRLANEGADVVVSDISQSGIRYTEDDHIEGWQGLKDVEAEIRALGRRVLAIEADVSLSREVAGMVARSITEFGKIDILVNNAGITGPQGVPLLELTEEDWNRVLAVNLTGTYLCCKTVAKQLIERRLVGRIINISSIWGKVGGAVGWGAYAVSKFGVVGLTQMLAQELGQYKIYVNAVCPGFIATELARGYTIRSDVRTGMDLDGATRKAYAEVLPRIPLGRAGQAEDIAKVVAFLASTESDYMTGQAINVCGGFLMAH